MQLPCTRLCSHAAQYCAAWLHTNSCLSERIFFFTAGRTASAFGRFADINGFGGAMSMVVGVDMDGAVTGVSVPDHSETANIGTKVVNDQTVLDRFIDMSHADGEITVNSGTNRFDGVSGATVSSKGVTAGVNTALAAVAEQKGGEA